LILGVSKLIIPNHYDVANALGSTLSKIAITVERIVSYGKVIKVLNI
jgi:hypothetical protein